MCGERIGPRLASHASAALALAALVFAGLTSGATGPDPGEADAEAT